CESSDFVTRSVTPACWDARGAFVIATRDSFVMTTRPGGALSRPTVGSPAQVENDHALVLQDGRVVGPQVAVERGVVSEPPESRPGKNQVTRPAPPQPPKRPDGRMPVCRRVERNPAAAQKGFVGRPLMLIDQDERVAGGDYGLDLLRRLLQPVVVIVFLPR